jgi:hypothetical protein
VSLLASSDHVLSASNIACKLSQFTSSVGVASAHSSVPGVTSPHAGGVSTGGVASHAGGTSAAAGASHASLAISSTFVSAGVAGAASHAGIPSSVTGGVAGDQPTSSHPIYISKSFSFGICFP